VAWRYVLIGEAAAQAGNLLWLSLVLALMSELTGLSYAELGSMFPTAAGEYQFARQAFNPCGGGTSTGCVRTSVAPSRDRRTMTAQIAHV